MNPRDAAVKISSWLVGAKADSSSQNPLRLPGVGHLRLHGQRHQPSPLHLPAPRRPPRAPRRPRLPRPGQARRAAPRPWGQWLRRQDPPPRETGQALPRHRRQERHHHLLLRRPRRQRPSGMGFTRPLRRSPRKGGSFPVWSENQVTEFSVTITYRFRFANLYVLQQGNQIQRSSISMSST